MNTQHTPGPWSSSGTAGHETHGQSVVYSEISGTDIAIVYDGKSNAHVIAAAPELLKALEQCVDILERCADDAEECGYDQRAENARADIATARTAIQKARGQ